MVTSPSLTRTTRGHLLGLIPLLAALCILLSVSRATTIFLSLVPLGFLAIMDVLESRWLQRDMKIPYRIPPGASASKGREKLNKMLPKKTGKRYLIVGTGGVGRRLITMLQQRGETNVYGFDLVDHSKLDDILELSQFIKGDVTDLQSCQTAIEKIKPDVVFHTAAVITYAQRKPSQWPLSYNVNVQGVLNMLQASTESSVVKSFVLTSSAVAGLGRRHLHTSVQGDEARFPPITSEQDALSWYTRSKALAEEKALEYCADHPKAPAFGIIRPASGIFHHLDPFGMGQALVDMHAPAIGFERTTLDWVFRDNVVLGHLLLEKQLNAGKCRGETFLISNQEPFAAMELYRRVKAFAPSFVYWKMPSTFVFFLACITEATTTLGLKVPKELGLLSYTTLDLATVHYVMNDHKAQEMLGYQPAFTVDEAILQTIEDHQKAYPSGGLAKAMRAKKVS